MNFFSSSPKLPYALTVSSANFTLSLSVSGTLPYHTCIISLTSHSPGSPNTPLAASFKWYRISPQNQILHLDSINGNSYVFSPMDIGYKFRVEVSSLEQGYSGNAILNIERIILDPAVKNVLEGILNVGGSSFRGTVVDGKGLEGGANLLISDEKVRILVREGRGEQVVEFAYGVEFPKIRLSLLDMSMVTFEFGKDGEGYFSDKSAKMEKLTLKMPSKMTRDLVVLAIKTFSAKKQLRNAKILSFVENCFSGGDKLFKTKEDNDLIGDLMLELGQLKAENIHLNDLIRALRRDKETYMDQVLSLESEITETIETYTKIIEDMNAGNNKKAINSFNSSISRIREEPKSVRELESRILRLESHNAKLLEELEVALAFNQKEEEVEKYEPPNLSEPKENKEHDKFFSTPYTLINGKGKNPNLLSANANNEKDAIISDLEVKNQVLQSKIDFLSQVSNNYFVLMEKYRILDDLLKEQEQKLKYFEGRGKEEFRSDRKSKIFDLPEQPGLVVINKEEEKLQMKNNQLIKKIESLQKEIEKKENVHLIESLSKSNEKLVLENQKLFEDLQQKNDDLHLIKHGSRINNDLQKENEILQETIAKLQANKKSFFSKK